LPILAALLPYVSLAQNKKVLAWVTCKVSEELNPENRLNKTKTPFSMKFLKPITALFLLASVVSVSLTSCDDSKKKAEEAAKKAADSLAAVEAAAAAAQRVADSIAALPKSIAATAMATPALSTLVAALGAADLASVFEGSTAYTVFAPTNDAFSAVQKTVDMLLKPENKGKLGNVLKYHVVEGTFKAADLKDGQKLKTLQGEELTVKVADGKVMINDAEVTSADVAVSNGVVHVISKVVVPKKM
jgi:uncharacterized surface protein with fasciclin (FAS1) repeats